MHHDNESGNAAIRSVGKRRLPSVAVFAIPVLAVVAWWLSDIGDKTPTPSDASQTAVFGWRAGDQRVYELGVDRSIRQGEDAMTGPATQTVIHAQLCLRVLAAASGGASVAMQLQQVAHETAGVRDAQREAALSLPFVVEFDGGMPTEFAFPASFEADVRSELEEMVRTLQVTLSPTSASKWSALEEHETGRYRAAYQMSAEGDWHKRKAAYLPGKQGTRTAGDSIRVFESSATFSLSSNASWWHRAEVQEDVQLSLMGKPFARAVTRTRLQARTAGIDASIDIVQLDDADDLLRAALPVGEAAGVAVASAAGAEDHARFEVLIAKWVEGGGKDFNLVHGMAAMLKQFPELAVELLPHLAKRDLGAAASAGLVHAMELAGNGACQDALSTVCTNATYPRDNRKRAIIGLGGIKAPTKSSVDALWQMTGSYDPDGGQDLANSALLALGSLASHLQETDAKRASDVSLGLRAKLLSVAPEGRSVVLTAIYNTHDASLLPTVQAELSSSNSVVRAAAAMAVSGMDRPAAFDSLFGRIKTEQDAWVRTALINGMGEQSHKSEDAFRQCVEMIRTEKDSQVRKALAKYLVNNLEHYPAGRPVLQEIMDNQNTNRQLRDYLVKSLHRTKFATRRSMQRR